MPAGYGARARFFTAFDPTMGAGLTAWYRELYTASASNVSQWADKSGNAFHATQASGPAKPVVATDAAIGNHESYTFTSSSIMALVAKSSLFTTSAFTIYALVKMATATLNNIPIHSSNCILSDRISFLGNFAVARKPTASRVEWGADNPTAISNPFTLADATWTKCCWSYDGTRAYARKSGGTDAGVICANVNAMSDVLNLMDNAAGSIAELIFYNGYHALATQDLIFDYQLGYFGV